MKNFTRLLALLVIITTINSCKSSKNVVKTEDKEVEIIIPCSGEKFRSDKNYIRANSMGESQDMTLAKKKARNNTLQELGSKIQTTVQSVVDNYQNATGNQNGESISKRYEELTREVIDLKISNYTTACEKLTQTAQGTYRSYIAYEIKIDDLIEPLSEKISQDEVLRIDYNYEKFKKNFMEALEKNR